MKITGKGTALRLFDDSNKEIIGLSRLVLRLPGRDIIITPNSQLRETIHAKQIQFIAEVYQTKQNGKGWMAVRDEVTGKFKLAEVKGTADIVIEK